MKSYVVPVQSACNCNCVPCITKVRTYDKEQKILKVDQQFIDNITTLRDNGFKSFEITGGGEPYLNPDLKGIVGTIRTSIPDSFIKIYTNGYMPTKISGIDEVNISLMHYNDEVNQTFMRSNSDEGIMSRLARFRILYPDSKIRLSVALCNGATDNWQELQQLIDLTYNKYVDSYVVRSLYPGTPGLEKLHVPIDESFEEYPFIKYERDNGVDDFNGTILWSDNRFYTNWNLNKERTFDTTYLLLKPDSSTWFNEIYQMVNDRSFRIEDIYLMNDFVNMASVLYEDKKNDSDYYKIVMNHLKNISYLFGNTGLVMTLKSNSKSRYEDTYKLKKEIRNAYAFTESQGGFITRGENTSHANLVHAPDGMASLYTRDLNSLKENGIFTADNKLASDEVAKVKRYSSYRGIK